MNRAGRKPAPVVKTLAKRSKEISLVRLLSKSQMTKGSSRNISAPLTRCRIDTMPAGGSL